MWGRYHSWVVQTPLPQDLVATSFDDNQQLMSLRHKVCPLRAVQFHPESILTPFGKIMLEKLDQQLNDESHTQPPYTARNLDRKESEGILTGIAEGQYNSSQIACFLTVFMIEASHSRN